MLLKRFGNFKERSASNMSGHVKRECAVTNMHSEEAMSSSKKSAGKICPNPAGFLALLIGCKLRNDSISFIGGVGKEKYTTPHDFALR
jgi:hypothetical protein